MTHTTATEFEDWRAVTLKSELADWDLNAGLVLTALALHGPTDITVTALFWEFETNPVALELGIGPWLAVKVGAILALACAWYLASDHVVTTVMLALLTVVGVLLVLPNVVIVSVMG